MPGNSSIFYHPDYLKIQDHKNLHSVETEYFLVHFSIANDLAISMPNGLFGSVEKRKSKATISDFAEFWADVSQSLRQLGVTRVELVHPQHIYSGFVQEPWLEEVGFSIHYEDTGHYIPLKKFGLHKMEQRKLDKLGNRFRFEVMDHSKLDETYSFLQLCRKEREQPLNIELKKLAKLIAIFPDRYRIFWGLMEDELACVTITLQTNKEIVYYFLPGTSEKFRSESPMVAMLFGIVDHYAEDFKYLDLGISSYRGVVQSGLATFKERMGGVVTVKKRFYAFI